MIKVINVVHELWFTVNVVHECAKNREARPQVPMVWETRDISSSRRAICGPSVNMGDPLEGS